MARASPDGPSAVLSSVGAAAALAVVAAVAVLVAGAAQVGARSSGVLPSLADAGAVGTVVGVVDGDARILPPAWPGAPARARVTLAAARAVGAGRSGGATGPVVVLGPVSWAATPFGTRVEVTGRLVDASGGRDVALVTTTQDPVVVAPPAPWHAAAGRVRAHVVDLASTLPGDAGALLPGVTVGDTTRVPDDLVAAMRTAGLTHVMAVSGAHFALVAGLVLAICTGLGVPRRARALAVVASMAALVVLVHPAPSVLRAALMGTVGALGLVVGRPSRAPAALAATVVVLLVVDPWLGSELGFVLSVLATAGLVLLGGPFAERWSRRAGRPLATALAVPVSAQLVCAPVLLLMSPTVAPLAVPANILVAPAVGPATVLGLAAALLDGVWPTGAQLLATCAGAACWWIGAVARVCARAPLAQVPWAAGPLGVALLATCGVCVARLLLRRPARRTPARPAPDLEAPAAAPGATAGRDAGAPAPGATAGRDAGAAAADAGAAPDAGAAAPDGGCR